MKLTKQERSDQLSPLLANGWSLVDGRDAICKTYQFRNFIEAFGWMTRVALWLKSGTTTRNGTMSTAQ